MSSSLVSCSVESESSRLIKALSESQPKAKASALGDSLGTAAGEAAFCRDFTCCGVKLNDLHALVEHFEDVHVRVVAPQPPFAIPQLNTPLQSAGFDLDELDMDLEDSSPSPMSPDTSPQTPSAPFPSAFDTASVFLPSRRGSDGSSASFYGLPHTALSRHFTNAVSNPATESPCFQPALLRLAPGTTPQPSPPNSPTKATSSLGTRANQNAQPCQRPAVAGPIVPNASTDNPALATHMDHEDREQQRASSSDYMMSEMRSWKRICVLYPFPPTSWTLLRSMDQRSATEMARDWLAAQRERVRRGCWECRRAKRRCGHATQDNQRSYSDSPRNVRLRRGTDYSHSSTVGYSVGPETRHGVGPVEPQPFLETDDSRPRKWHRMQSSQPSSDIQRSVSIMQHGLLPPRRKQGPTMLPVVSSPPGAHVYPHHDSHEISHQRLTTTTINQFHDPIDMPPHSSYHTTFQSAAATPQYNTVFPEYALLPADHSYTPIPTNSPTESIISSGSANSNPPLFGQTEGASALTSANEGRSNWMYDPTIPHSFQRGSCTGPNLDYFDISPIPITAAVPQALASAHGGEPAPDLGPRLLADLHELITPGPPVSVELSRYQNYPVAPVEISGISVVQQRREVATWLTLDLSSVPTHNAMPWSAVRISRTPSVHAHRESPQGVNVLGVDIVVSGAETHKEYTEACDSCKERRGAGPMIDHRSKTNLVKVTKGRVRLRFVFCCYPADRDQEKYYRVDVVLSERLTDGQRHVIVRKQLPYYFDVYSRRMVERASDLEETRAAPGCTTPTS